MANRVVIGSQWGDEGKAKVVDFLTLDADIIVRFQGGANAGHTVEVGDQKFVFHLIPSGIMHKDKICVIGNGVVLDPIQTLAEIADLHTKGINPEGRLFIIVILGVCQVLKSFVIMFCSSSRANCALPPAR